MLLSQFTEQLIELNGLKKMGFVKWAFFPGMLFNSVEKWWADGGTRSVPHEGLDIGLFKDNNNKIHELHNIIIPVMFHGEIVKIEDDFLGKSIFVRHRMDNDSGKELYTIYGHTVPGDKIRPGRTVNAGDIIAKTAQTQKEYFIISHLHITTAWINKSIPVEKLNWDVINNSTLIDISNPFDFFNCDYDVVNNTKPGYK